MGRSTIDRVRVSCFLQSGLRLCVFEASDGGVSVFLYFSEFLLQLIAVVLLTFGHAPQDVHLLVQCLYLQVSICGSELKILDISVQLICV